MNPRAVFVDIDGTLTDNDPANVYPAEKHVWRNPIFGVIRDAMVDAGWDAAEARRRIEEYADAVVWWDYPDFLAEFSLDPARVWERIHAWHDRYQTVHTDGAEMVERLHARGVPLFVVSNNPIVGCLLKLRRAGLGEITGSPYFRRILGANILRGQKSQPALWLKAFAQVGIPPGDIVVVGDNPREDGDIPLSLGLGRAVIVVRSMAEDVRDAGSRTFVRSLALVPDILVRTPRGEDRGDRNGKDGAT